MIRGRVSAAGTEPARTGVMGTERFRLLASAIGGTWLDVAPTEPGEPAWTDGATVFVDPTCAPDRLLASLVVQASLLGSGSLRQQVVSALVRRPDLARRYLAIEAHRALLAQRRLLPPAIRGVVDEAIAARTGSPADSLAIARGRARIEGPPEIFGEIRPGRMQKGAELSGDSRVAGWQGPRRSVRVQLRELDEEADDGPVIDLLSSPGGGGGPIGRLLKRLFGEGRSSGDGPPGAHSSTRWSHRTAPGTRVLAPTGAAQVSARSEGMEGQGTTYPEWDVHKRRYKRDWCTVLEVDPSPNELAPLVPPDTRALRRALGRLGTDLERHRRQLQGDDVDVDAAVEARVDLRAGSAPTEAVYIDALRRRRELAVLVLLDISESAREPSATGVPVHEHQRSAAAALITALFELGDRVALYGFRSHGRSAVNVLRLKRFDQGLDASVLERVGGIVPGAYTRLGTAIRHGAAVLEREAGTSRRLLAVLSDGFAYDHGYERSYGEADARHALAEVRRRGIGCLCLSIGAPTDVEALRRVFGTAAHGAIPRVELLQTVVGPLFRSALDSAELHRTSSQRRVRTMERLAVERRTA